MITTTYRPRLCCPMSDRVLILRADVLDRIQQALERLEKHPPEHYSSEYGDGYYEALADLADTMTGYCHSSLQIPERGLLDQQTPDVCCQMSDSYESRLAEFLRTTHDLSALTDDEIAEMLESGDEYDALARALIRHGWTLQQTPPDLLPDE